MLKVMCYFAVLVPAVAVFLFHGVGNFTLRRLDRQGGQCVPFALAVVSCVFYLLVVRGLGVP